MPPWVAKEKMGTLLLASEMPVPIPRSRTVVAIETSADHRLHVGHDDDVVGMSSILRIDE